jgi:hypothetical protein
VAERKGSVSVRVLAVKLNVLEGLMDEAVELNWKARTEVMVPPRFEKVTLAGVLLL